LLFFRC